MQIEKCIDTIDKLLYLLVWYSGKALCEPLVFLSVGHGTRNGTLLYVHLCHLNVRADHLIPRLRYSIFTQTHFHVSFQEKVYYTFFFFFFLLKRTHNYTRTGAETRGVA